MAAGTVAAAACGGDVTFQGSESASSTTAGSSSSSSSGGNEQVCGEGAPLAAACLQAPLFPWGPSSGLVNGTVSGLTSPSPSCFAPPSGDGSCISVPAYPGEAVIAEAVWFTIDTPEGQFVAGVSVKGFTPDRVPVGEPIGVGFENNYNGTNNPALMLEFWAGESDNEVPLVVVGANAFHTVAIERGDETCRREDQICGYSDHDMLVGFGGEAIALGRHETANLGGLLITNDRYTQLYDLGACNFADPVDFRYYGVRANP